MSTSDKVAAVKVMAEDLAKKDGRVESSEAEAAAQAAVESVKRNSC